MTLMDDTDLYTRRYNSTIMFSKNGERDKLSKEGPATVTANS
jgi:hypothetical protein